MDEKSPTLQDLPRSSSPTDRRRRSRNYWEAFAASWRDRSIRRLIIVICFITTVWALFSRSGLPSDKAAGTEKDDESGASLDHPDGVFANYTRVPLEAHIMSKCPDTRRCIPGLVVPAMEKISDKVDFELSFLGSLDPSSDAVECMHGPGECLGNIIILCAEHLYPSTILYLGFANCLITAYEKIPERDHVEHCALEHGLDFGKINECISDDSGEGVALLRDSVERTNLAGVKKSCTIRLEGEEYCVIDGGRWKGCKEGRRGVDDLIDTVERRWNKLNGLKV